MRRLVVSFHVTVANYEYLVYWRFYQDGNIECEVRATGIMVTSHPVRAGQPPPYGTVVDTQHLRARSTSTSSSPGSTWRSTGRDNTVYVIDPRPRGRSAPDNPLRAGLTVRSTPLRTEAEGKQDYDWSTQRGLEGHQPQRHRTASAPRSATSSCPPAAFPPDDRPRLAGAPAGAGDRPHAVGHAVRPRTSAGPAATSRTRARRDSGLPVVDRGRPARSRTPMSCSGTSSASTTSPGRRTGR